METPRTQTFPVDEAFVQWQTRHEMWASQRAFESLDPHLDPDFKAIRDHSDFPEAGLGSFVEKVETYANRGSNWTHNAYAALSHKIYKATSWLTPNQGEQLFEALVSADHILVHVRNDMEQNVLEDPGVALAFMREVLVDKPNGGDSALSEEEFSSLVCNKDQGSQQNLSVIPVLGQIVHNLSGSMTAKGVKLWLDEPRDDFDGNTALQIIKYGHEDDKYMLLDDVVIASRH